MLALQHFLVAFDEIDVALRRDVDLSFEVFVELFSCMVDTLVYSHAAFR